MVDFSSLNEYKMPELDADGYIYFLFYRGTLVYIGKSISLSGRLSAHTKNKYFETVKYEACAVERLKDRECELIKNFNPVLNGEFGCKPSKGTQIIEDAIFVHRDKKCYKIYNGEVYFRQAHVGFCDGKRICIFDEYSIDSYNEETDTWTYEKLIKTGKNFDFHKVYKFDEGKFTYVQKVELIENKSGVWVDAKSREAVHRLPKNYVFRFGKYKGKTYAEVEKENKGYIKWFEETIHPYQW